jgi:hypothetical protein
MADIAKKRDDRSRVLKMIYDAADGRSQNFVSGEWLLEASGLPDQELGDICDYLKGERLIEPQQTLWGHHTPYMMRLTHRGIQEMERSAEAEASAATAQINLVLVRDALRMFEAAGEALDLPEEDAGQLAADMNTVKAQVGSPRPDHETIRKHLSAAKNILVSAAGNMIGSAAAVGLIDAITYALRH